MFTGIVEELGIVKSLERKRDFAVLLVSAKIILKGIKKGDSVAISGACLTVTTIRKNELSFDIMKESLDKTTLKILKKGDRVNLERAMKMGSRFNGHFVTGHVDNVGKILKRIDSPNYTELQISGHRSLARFIVEKGSICLDGVSLTVGKVLKNGFVVYLIPFTKKITTLGSKKPGDTVNIEIDTLAKYILRT